MTTREQAIRILAVCASSSPSYSTMNTMDRLNYTRAAQRLAFDALWATNYGDRMWRARYAEAECLLREGWTP